MYLDAAEQEREKYMQEMAAYKQTEAYRQFNEHKQKKKAKTNLTEEVMTLRSWNWDCCRLIFRAAF